MFVLFFVGSKISLEKSYIDVRRGEGSVNVIFRKIEVYLIGKKIGRELEWSGV